VSCGYVCLHDIYWILISNIQLDIVPTQTINIHVIQSCVCTILQTEGTYSRSCRIHKLHAHVLKIKNTHAYAYITNKVPRCLHVIGAAARAYRHTSEGIPAQEH
jgi:hypothetical protein